MSCPNLSPTWRSSKAGSAWHCVAWAASKHRMSQLVWAQPQSQPLQCSGSLSYSQALSLPLRRARPFRNPPGAPLAQTSGSSAALSARTSECSLDVWRGEDAVNMTGESRGTAGKDVCGKAVGLISSYHHAGGEAQAIPSTASNYQACSIFGEVVGSLA